MSHSNSWGGALALALTVACSGAHAQQAEQSETGGAVELPRVEATAPAAAGDAPQAAPDGSLSAPSVAEQRQRLDQTVGSIDFVDANTPAIQTRHVETLVDALKDSPGVYVQDRYGQEVRISIRGSGLTRFFHLRGIELLQDGVPVNLADGSGDFDQIDTLYFRSIEVFKGGNALVFGTSTLGGAIDFVSPTAYTALAPDIVRLDGGSFGSIRGQVQVSRVMGDFDFLINGTFGGSTGYREHSNNSYELINGNIGYRFAPWAETRFYFGAYNAAQLIPGQLSYSQALNTPTMASASASGSGYSGNQARDIFDQRIANKTTFLTDWGRLDLDSWYIHNTLYHPIYIVLDQYGYTAGFAPRLTSKVNLGGFRNDIIVGGRVWGGEQADRRYVNFNGFEQTQLLNAREGALNLELYGENRFFITPEVALMAGVKLFSQNRQYTDLGGVPADPNYQFDKRVYNAVLPKAGVIWNPTPDIQVFGDFTGSEDVPDFTDLTQTFGTTSKFVPLKAQRAWTGEIGTRGQWDRFNWNVTFYRADLHNELLQFTVGGPLGVPANTFNADHTIHQGVEFGAGVDVVRDLSVVGDAIYLSQVWTLNNFTFVNSREFGDNQIAGAPPNVLRTTLSYRRPDGLYIAPSLDWAPVGAWADYANTVLTTGFALLGLQAGLNLPSGFSLYVDLRNLTNQHFISDTQMVINASVPANQQIYFPGNGRAVYGGLKVIF